MMRRACFLLTYVVCVANAFQRPAAPLQAVRLGARVSHQRRIMKPGTLLRMEGEELFGGYTAKQVGVGVSMPAWGKGSTTAAVATAVTAAVATAVTAAAAAAAAAATATNTTTTLPVHAIVRLREQTGLHPISTISATPATEGGDRIAVPKGPLLLLWLVDGLGPPGVVLFDDQRGESLRRGLARRSPSRRRPHVLRHQHCRRGDVRSLGFQGLSSRSSDVEADQTRRR